MTLTPNLVNPAVIVASENCLNHVIMNTVVEILLDDPDSEGKGADGKDSVEE